MKNINMGKKRKKEDKFNIPNLFCYTRIILAIILVYIIIKGYNPWTIVILYSVAALTDAFDGWFARKFNLKTEIVRRLDMLADRILMILVILSFIYYLFRNNLLTNIMITQLVLIMSREIISTPMFLFSILNKRKIIFPNAKKIGKLTTLLQGFAFPILILQLPFVFYFSVLTGVIGILAGIKYNHEFLIIYKKKR